MTKEFFIPNPCLIPNWNGSRKISLWSWETPTSSSTLPKNEGLGRFVSKQVWWNCLLEHGLHNSCLQENIYHSPYPLGQPPPPQLLSVRKARVENMSGSSHISKDLVYIFGLHKLKSIHVNQTSRCQRFIIWHASRPAFNQSGSEWFCLQSK